MFGIDRLPSSNASASTSWIWRFEIERENGRTGDEAEMPALHEVDNDKAFQAGRPGA